MVSNKNSYKLQAISDILQERLVLLVLQATVECVTVFGSHCTVFGSAERYKIKLSRVDYSKYIIVSFINSIGDNDSSCQEETDTIGLTSNQIMTVVTLRCK